MASLNNRYSSYSNSPGPAARGASSNHQPAQVSTQTLLTALHTSYSSAEPYSLDIGTSLVVNTWITAGAERPTGLQGATVDPELVNRAFEHARRRTEDGCIVLGSLHESTPSTFGPFLAAMPFAIPATFHTAIAAVQPFLHCVTPQNPSASRASALAATFTLTNESGTLKEAVLQLSQSGIDVQAGLINIPREQGYRAFDALYYLLNSASTPSEREFLGLKTPSAYTLLKRSQTYAPPSYVPTADDSASAEDFRAALKAIGISGSARRNLVSTLVALLHLGETLGFLVDGQELDSAFEDAAGLLGINPEVLMRTCSTADREVMIAGIYEALIDWVIAKANEAVANEISGLPLNAAGSRPGASTPATEGSDSEDSMSLTVVEIPGSDLGKAVSLKTIFDDSEGINAEMKEDGVVVNPAGHSVLTEMNQILAAHEAELGIIRGPAGREREVERDRRNAALDKIGHESEDDSFLRTLLFPVPDQGIVLGKRGRFDLMSVVGSSRVWFQLSLHPTDAPPSTLSTSVAAWSAGSVSRQLRSWRLPEWANRRNKQLDYTADYDMLEFCNQYKSLGCKDGYDGIESFILERGWSNGEVVIGNERVWMREGAYMEAETMRDMIPQQQAARLSTMGSIYGANQPETGSIFLASQYRDNASVTESRENLLQRSQSNATLARHSHLGGARSFAPTAAQTARTVSGGDYGLGTKGDTMKGALTYENELDPELGDPKSITEHPITVSRRLWAGFVWALTFWIPSFVLRFAGCMKRPDVRMAWREKLVLVVLIFFLNAFVVFYIIVFGRLLCPNFDKAWNQQQLSYHQGTNDFYVAVRGRVYDISKFWQIDHSNINSEPVTNDIMLPLAGHVLDPMFPLPLYIACPGLVSKDSLFTLTPNASNSNVIVLNSFFHISGPKSLFPDSALANPRWYNETFMPKMKHYYIGELVTSTATIKEGGQVNGHDWFTIGDNVYDLSDYFYTVDEVYQHAVGFTFFPESFTNLVQEQRGNDISENFKHWSDRNPTVAKQTLNCLNNQFYIGKTDFRDTPRCQVNNYILLAFTIVLCAVILVKFLAALQLGGKRRPAAQDKFVICQVPCYTEGEDHLRKGLDSLTALAYDNKRKLICVICDGMIVGGGNDRPTPKIVLDILGVDPKVDPPALPFRSVGQGSEQLNYGKVYSGLYEYEGNVVPYIVVVKVGKESEQTKAKPGNRGKRDSQILLMSFLNRVHHRSPMSPLELEMFHQINNIIGVDPELYEYLFMVDADTSVKEDSLNRLVASCANDAKIAGICGETSLENEERSWWTMIQVYEYYISHHLAKAFESLFGSVTCLPGCFCMYRLRTADKGKPLIISDDIVKEYSDCEVDTLHKKNLLSLGEDRYLTTLMTRHFPHMSYKFVPDAYALTAAPETWSVLLSQRRRWINSTIHNLVELMVLKDLCGFCCFSMRFVVFIDLFGTLMLPATCAYLGYLIYRVSSDTGQFPLISVIMIAAVYGLQAVIFIIKRQWQHVGWMIIYILAFPVYSFILPIYAFWKQDDFSWGNTRVVIGEKGNKQIVAVTEDEGFDPRSIPLQRWDDYATANNLPGRRGLPEGADSGEKGYEDGGYEMDDMQSVYGAIKPASTILSGFKAHGPGNLYMPPQSPALYPQMPGLQNRGSIPNFAQYTDYPTQPQHGRLMSLGNISDRSFQQHPVQLPMQQQQPWSLYGSPSPVMNHYQQSSENLLSGMGSPLNRAGTHSPMGFGGNAMSSPSRPGSAIVGVPDFLNSVTGHNGPSDAQIVAAIQAVLSVVDMDSVTKKQVRSLVETRLQTTFSAQRKEFLDERIDIELANM